ncbi:MAG: elongation factor P [Planctomycetes bacterium]|nr:elongation factor P [Planctomycetota bacterium]
MTGAYNVGDLKKGLKVLLDNEPYLIIETDFMKPGKGQAVYRTKLRNLIRGNVIERTYRSGDKLDAADVTEMTLEYMYNDSKNWFFMNMQTFEQFTVPKDGLNDANYWLKEGAVTQVTFWGERAITVEAPKHVELEVTYCEPAARGNTATNVQKAARLETGVEIQVPAFINTGDIVKVDTRTSEYIERISKS